MKTEEEIKKRIVELEAESVRALANYHAICGAVTVLKDLLVDKPKDAPPKDK